MLILSDLAFIFYFPTPFWPTKLKYEYLFSGRFLKNSAYPFGRWSIFQGKSESLQRIRFTGALLHSRRSQRPSRLKLYVCDLSLAGIACSKPGVDMGVCLLRVLCGLR